MKAKLTLTIDEALIPLAKDHARLKKLSLSQLIEDTLRGEVTAAGSPAQTFSHRWRGRFVPSGREDERAQGLRRRYR
jgi:Family of unknown function (DUF6364)